MPDSKAPAHSPSAASIGIRAWMALLVSLLAVSRPLAAQENDSTLKEQYSARREAYLTQLNESLRAGKTAEAVSVAERLAELGRALLAQGDSAFNGEEQHLALVRAQHSTVLEWLAVQYQERGDLAGGQAALEENLELKSLLYGADNWRVVDTRLAVERLRRIGKMTAEQRQELQEAGGLHSQSMTLLGQGRHADALPLAIRSAAKHKSLFGEHDPDYARDLHTLAFLYRKMGRDAEAEQHYLTAARIRRQLLGETHPSCAVTLYNLADLYMGQEKLAHAEGLLGQVLQIVRQLARETRYQSDEKLQNLPELYTSALSKAAVVYAQRGELAKAEAHYFELLQFQRQTLGQDHPEFVATARRLIALYRSIGAEDAARSLLDQLPREEQLLDRIDSLLPRLKQLLDEANAREALPVAEETLQYQRELIQLATASETDQQTLTGHKRLLSTTLDLLIGLYEQSDNLAQAVAACEELIHVRSALLGHQHWQCSEARARLARLVQLQSLSHQQRRQLADARELAKQAVEQSEKGALTQALALAARTLQIDRQVLGPQHMDVGVDLANLAQIHEQLGHYANAEPLYRGALEIIKQSLGELHPSFAAATSNLGLLLHKMQDLAEADRLCRQAVQILEQLGAESHADYPVALNNLALVLQDAGEVQQAGTLYLKALQRADQAEPGLQYILLNNLADLYIASGEFARAEQLHKASLELRRQAVGERHPDYARSLANLASLYYEMEDYARAEEFLQQSLVIRETVLGETHAQSCVTSFKLAQVLCRLGRFEAAADLLQQTLTAEAANLELFSVVQSERQQLLTAGDARLTLSLFLTVSAQLDIPAAQVYDHVLTLKGLVFTRQRQSRFIRGHADPELARLFGQLQATATRLATLAFATPNLDELAVWKAEIDRLKPEKERLERALAAASSKFRQQQRAAQTTSATLLQSLPEDVVLIDFLEAVDTLPNRNSGEPSDSSGRLAAFVLRRDRPVTRIDLGPVEPIEAAAREWRGAIERRGGGPDRPDSADSTAVPSPQEVLRRLVWSPIQEHLAQADTVLVSPDGPLTRIPLAALPGSQPGKFLLEEKAIVVITAPQMLPDLMNARQNQPQGLPPEPALLLLGDINFSETPAAAPVEQSRLQPDSRAVGRLAAGYEFPPLPGTKREIEVLDRLFSQSQEGHAEVASGTSAGEAWFKRAAANFHTLHLATHGFFAAEGIQSALSEAQYAKDGKLLSESERLIGFNPGLLSGLALAGASRDPDRQSSVDDDSEDGILTALEVGDLDLGNVELVVLSACETGLGRTAGGEGILGLQRAFHVAGADSVVASLWKVDDAATQALMVEFYRNLWGKQLGKVDALRQAQLTILNQYEWRTGRLRGVTDLDDSRETMPSGRTPILYWGAFVLSGQWR